MNEIAKSVQPAGGETLQAAGAGGRPDYAAPGLNPGRASLRAWYEQAGDLMRPLPANVYTCPDLWARELDQIFAREWIWCGHVSELAVAGDFLTFRIIDTPLIVLRDEEGELRAFANVCQHRGAALVEGQGRRPRFSCPYHAWTYDLNGRLEKAPYMDGIDLTGVRLREYPVEVWLGLVFVSLNPEATPLAPRLEGLEERQAPLRIPEGTVISRTEHHMACNWKMLVENFCESYHIFRVHPESIEPVNPSHTIQVGPGGTGFNDHTMAMRREGREDSVLRLNCLYPCFTSTSNPANMIILSVQPTGPATLRYLCEVVLLEASEMDPAGEEARKMVAWVHAFLDEDRKVIEGVQRNLAAGINPSGPLHEWERTNWEFGRYVARQVL